VLLAKALDREDGTSPLSFVVVASDGVTSVSTTVTLTVTDVNDNTPVFNSAVYTSVWHCGVTTRLKHF
jgi:hypothetical protein